MKPLLKNTKENYNREEKQEEDNLFELLKFLKIFYTINFYRGLKNLTI